MNLGSLLFAHKHTRFSLLVIKIHHFSTDNALYILLKRHLYIAEIVCLYRGSNKRLYEPRLRLYCDRVRGKARYKHSHFECTFLYNDVMRIVCSSVLSLPCSSV